MMNKHTFFSTYLPRSFRIQPNNTDHRYRMHLADDGGAAGGGGSSVQARAWGRAATAAGLRPVRRSASLARSLALGARSFVVPSLYTRA